MELAAEISSLKPTFVIRSRKGLFQLDLAAVWQYRELLFFLVWRDVKVRYKQSAVGVGWTILQPVITMLIFTLIFSRIAKFPSDGIPYPIFVFSALIPWTYFAQALTRSSNSVVASSQLVTKIYFPRLLIPLSAAIAPLVDLFFTFLVLVALMFWYGMTPTSGLLALPLFLGLAVATVLAVGLWSAALNVRYRDVGYIIPFLIQIGMYLSPIFYPVSMIPEKWRALYSLNPLAGVIEGFRWALLGKERPDLAVMAVSTTVVLVLLFGGIVYFKRMERIFADVI
jgi:lipopolysaccharide transport system permease protein